MDNMAESLGKVTILTEPQPTALIKAMRRQKLVSQVLFNDATLRNETFLGQKLCNFAPGHDDHIHFAIRPPVRA
jgi:hypothetical protein